METVSILIAAEIVRQYVYRNLGGNCAVVGSDLAQPGIGSWPGCLRNQIGSGRRQLRYIHPPPFRWMKRNGLHERYPSPRSLPKWQRVTNCSLVVKRSCSD